MAQLWNFQDLHVGKAPVNAEWDVQVDSADRTRKYVVYGDHLVCVTHGDMKASQQRKLNEIITAEARDLVGRTRYTSTHRPSAQPVVRRR